MNLTKAIKDKIHDIVSVGGNIVVKPGNLSARQLVGIITVNRSGRTLDIVIPLHYETPRANRDNPEVFDDFVIKVNEYASKEGSK
jgi:hypothetical protein